MSNVTRIVPTLTSLQVAKQLRGSCLTDPGLAHIAIVDRQRLQRARDEMKATDAQLDRCVKELFSIHRRRAQLIQHVAELEATVRP